MYRSKHFSFKELLPQSTYEMLESGNHVRRANRYIDDRVLITADALREVFGSAYANTWSFPKSITNTWGIHNYRGWRPMQCEIGALFSGHKFGDCLDLVFANKSAEDIRNYILDHPESFPYIIEIEDDISWVHFRVGLRGSADIIVIPRY